MTDSRRRRWIPLDAYFPHGKTAQNILNKFGHHGLLTWICLLTAAKRNEVQGEFWYFTEAEAWAKLGIQPPVDKSTTYTLDAFLTYTGHLKQTRRTRSGHLIKTTFTHWEDWNNRPRTGAGRADKPTNYKGIDDYDTRRNRAISAPKPRYERESESESESDSDALATQPNQDPVDNPPPASITDLVKHITKPIPDPHLPDPELEKQRQLKALHQLKDKPF